MKTNDFTKWFNILVTAGLLTALLAGMLPTSPVQAAPGRAAAFPAPFNVTYDCASVTQIPKDDCEALAILYNSTNGPNWTYRTGWLLTNTPCDWYGVSCSGEGVLRLVLPSNRLSGKIPVELGNMQHLQYIFLNNNRLTGSIPKGIGNLTQLKVLYLYDNQLNGSIPAQLGELTNLTDLWLWANQLTGRIPTEFGNLTKLTELRLDNNRLSSSIPTSLGNLTLLQHLFLENNLFSGEFPTSITNLVNLTHLSFSCGLTSTDSEVITFLDTLSPRWQSRCPTISGNTVGNVTLRYTDGAPRTVKSNESGNYAFSVPSGWSGLVTPSKKGYTFTPVKRTYTKVKANKTAQDYLVLKPFYSSFDGIAGAANWVKWSGGAWASTSKTFYTMGIPLKYSSTSYNHQQFTDFIYEVCMKQTADPMSASGLIVRGTPSSFDDYNNWKNAYEFLVTTSNLFTVRKRVGGSLVEIQRWKPTAALHVDWNTLKVDAKGSYLKFYINNIRVWTGTDDAFKKGEVGVIMFRGTETTVRLDLDWAKLSIIKGNSISESVGLIEQGQIEYPDLPTDLPPLP